MSKAEKFIQEHTKGYSNRLEWSMKTQDKEVSYFHYWLTPDEARKAVEIARKEELEYIKYQLELRLPETLDYNGVKVERKDFIEDFIKAIEND